VPDPETLGTTEPNAEGRTYRHGTLSGYNGGKCRCRPCRDAIASYRTARRGGGKDRPRVGRPVNTDGHIPNGWFRHQIWRPACKAVGLGTDPRPHDMRHAHASWLLAGGADLQVVKERLGHGSIRTTERYLHTLPDQDESAVDAFLTIRHRAARK
jgi:integrase